MMKKIGRIDRLTGEINKQLSQIYERLSKAQRINSTILNNEDKMENINLYSNAISQAHK